MYDPKTVLMAALLTTGLTIILTLYACFTKKDFTVCMTGMILVLYAFISFGLFMVFFGPSYYIRMLFCCIGVVIYGIYLVIDTQMIVGGRKHELDYDDYILGSVMLYVDIIGLFIYIL